jgi:hypothetical protein
VSNRHTSERAGRRIVNRYDYAVGRPVIFVGALSMLGR